MTKIWLTALALALATGAVSAQDARYVGSNPGPANGPVSGEDNAHYGWADVLRADPVQGVTRTQVPRQECYNQPVEQRSQGNTTAGTVLGAVIGGVLGNTIGKGDGRKAATVAGAVAGGAVGNRAAQGSDTTSMQTVCRDVSSVSEQRQIIGYDVEYRYHGDVYVSRLSYDPGDRLRVRISVTPAN